MSLLPLAQAQAVPAGIGGAAAVERAWSGGWAEAVGDLLAGLWQKEAPSATSRVAEVEPPDDRGDGTGIDPHGVPRPRQSQRPNTK